VTCAVADGTAVATGIADASVPSGGTVAIEVFVAEDLGTHDGAK
jgi:hypothetical protein